MRSVDNAPMAMVDFRIMDSLKRVRAVREHLCWICGQRLGRFLTFVAGPMCGVNRTSAEPPAHLDCAQYAARACPFLALPKATRRLAGLPAGHIEPAGDMIKRNPGVAMVWTTRTFRTFRCEGAGGGWLIEMGEPTSVEWYAEGREATRAEVDESIETGLPLLREVAVSEGAAAVEALARYAARFEKYLPALAP